MQGQRFATGPDSDWLPLHHSIRNRNGAGIVKKQLEALEHFHRLLTMAATLSLPKKYESAPDDPEHADIIRQHRDFAADVERARRRLLLAGCDVPNAWLPVKLQGQLRQS